MIRIFIFSTSLILFIFVQSTYGYGTPGYVSGQLSTVQFSEDPETLKNNKCDDAWAKMINFIRSSSHGCHLLHDNTGTGTEYIEVKCVLEKSQTDDDATIWIQGIYLLNKPNLDNLDPVAIQKKVLDSTTTKFGQERVSRGVCNSRQQPLPKPQKKPITRGQAT